MPRAPPLHLIGRRAQLLVSVTRRLFPALLNPRCPMVHLRKELITKPRKPLTDHFLLITWSYRVKVEDTGDAFEKCWIALKVKGWSFG